MPHAFLKLFLKFCDKKLDAIDPLVINDYNILFKMESSMFTNDQLFTLSRILEKICNKEQVIGFMHGGGGVGKTHVIKLGEIFSLRKYFPI